MLVLGQVFVKSIGRMYGLVFFCRIFASVLEDNLGSSRMFWKPLDIVDARSLAEQTWQKLRNIVCFAMDNDPARFLGVVLCDLFNR